MVKWRRIGSVLLNHFKDRGGAEQDQTAFM